MVAKESDGSCYHRLNVERLGKLGKDEVKHFRLIDWDLEECAFSRQNDLDVLVVQEARELDVTYSSIKVYSHASFVC